MFSVIKIKFFFGFFSPILARYFSIYSKKYFVSAVLPDLEIAVFDEIHNINSKCGDCYERIIKWHNGNFLALSATIKNPEIKTIPILN